MTPKEAYLKQIEEAKAHMGELRSVDGKSVEQLLADRAAEPTLSALLERYPPTVLEYPQGWMAFNDSANVVAAGPDEAYVREHYSLCLLELVKRFDDPAWPQDPKGE